MSTKKFNEIFRFAPKSKIKAGEGLEEGRFPFYTSSPLLSKFINRIQHEDEALIFGTGGSASVHYSDKPFSTSTDCIVAIGKDKNFNTKFIYYYLFGNLHILERGFKGAGLKHISKKYIQNIEIPVFDLEIQNKVVAILDKASALVQKRQQTIYLLDELLKAQFLEMFGSLASKTQKYPLKKLQEFEEFITSGGRGWKKYYSETGGRFIRSYDVQMNHISNEDIVLVNPPDNQEAKRTKVKPKDILLTITGSKIGRVTMVPPDFGHGYVSQHVAIIRVKDIDPLYLSYFLSHDGNGQYLVLRRQYGQTKPGLNFKQIRDFDIILPPLELQTQFTQIVEKVETTKGKFRESLIELENLFGSVSQRAFSGKLKYNVTIELDALLEEIDLQKPENDLYSIITNEEYLLSLARRLNSQEFENQDLYDKAKHAAFQLLKEEERLTQAYDEGSKSLKLVVK
jgi:type I restriction enzyme S subunit